MAGVTAEGFTKKTVEEIKQEIQDDQLSNVSPTLNQASNQPLGQMNAATSKKAAEIWELAEVAYNAFDRDAAEGRALDNLGTLTGTPREVAKKSKVTCTVNVNASFSQGAGLMMANVTGQPDRKFVNQDTVASVGGGNVTAVFEAVDYGPVPANAGTLTAITNPVTGWNSITNPTDAVLGSLVETDTSYRQRQIDELTAPGSSTCDAIRADLLKVTGVQQAFVFENVTLFTDSDGVPGKAIECVIYDGAGVDANDNEIAQAIWDSKPSGAETYGTTTATAIDSTGTSRTVMFSRAAIIPVYVKLTLTTDSRFYPTNGDDLVQDAVATLGNAKHNLDDDVIVLAVGSYALTIPGVIDADVRVGLAPSPSSTANIVITGRQIARFDTSRVEIA